MELSKYYDPAVTEKKWNDIWKENKYFQSFPDERKPFTICIPPPNVTGVLHMGHTLNETVQDILIRRARMSGLNACWVPGSDHASIATEAKVVQMLKDRGIDKHALSREEFLKYAFEWKEKYGNIIYGQIEKLGCSVDWNRVTFTMDDHYYRSVIKIFNELYKKGLIYRGARMINWDPAARTALSDEEVEYREVNGTLYHVKYQILDANGNPEEGRFITIATQRPETIMGDTAVCVNPNDPRYTSLKGKFALIPLINRKVPIIFDEYVDPEFGTGALKITPAHDINDYNIGLKYQLEIIDTLNEDGTLSEAAKVYVGTDRFVARKKIVEDLRNMGIIVKEETYATRLGYSQRSGAVVEPRISTQWFLKMESLAKAALDEVLSGNIKIHPEERFLNTYKHWLENVHDWCISRQLWWGQRIPAWYDEEGNCYVAENEEEAKVKAGGKSLRQDDDVLDTWFSSWIWPIEVFKGISEPGNPDFNYYYPTSVVVTGQDIIFFWIARMIMAGKAFTGKYPFEHVYFTGMVRDKQGRKMSKSLGNSPDLLDLIDKFGADAVRFGIMISAPAGNDLLFDETSPEQGKLFYNKIWNALKLVKMWESRVNFNNLSDDGAAVSGDVSAFASEPHHAEDIPIEDIQEFAVQWFANKLAAAKAEQEKLMQEFRLSEALKQLYTLIWDDFCSWYLEWVKPAKEEAMPAYTYNKTVEFFSELMHLLHPFMPFITEEIFALLKPGTGALCIKQYSAAGKADLEILEYGEQLKKAISALRDARIKNKLKSKDPIKLYIQSEDKALYAAVQQILMKQVNAESIAFTDETLGNTITVVTGKDKFYIQTYVTIDHSEQIAALEKELDYLKGFIASVEKKLNNEKFMQNAKPEVVEREKKKYSDAAEKIKIIEESLKELQ